MCKHGLSCQVIEGFEITLLGTGRIPDPESFGRRPVVTRRPSLPKRTEATPPGCAATFLIAVPPPFPRAHRAILAGRGDHVGVEPPTDVGDRQGVGPEVVEFAAGNRLPDQGSLLRSPDASRTPSGLNSSRSDPLGVLLLLVDELPVGRVVDP